jgi:hypothetical protein
LLKIEKTFLALGNKRPAILVTLEDAVIRAIVAISEGKSTEVAIDSLYVQISPLLKDLANDNEALSWFDLCLQEDVSTSSAPTPSDISTTPDISTCSASGISEIPTTPNISTSSALPSEILTTPLQGN